MRQKFIIFFFLLSILQVDAQVNPYGLNLTVDGKIELTHAEPNYNGNMDDPVEIRCGGQTFTEDLRNVMYNFLTLVEFPDQKWVMPSNADPSRKYDTSLTVQERINGIPQRLEYRIGNCIVDAGYFSHHSCNCNGRKPAQPEI